MSRFRVAAANPTSCRGCEEEARRGLADEFFAHQFLLFLSQSRGRGTRKQADLVTIYRVAWWRVLGS
jgi:hypothetical protein